MNVFSFGDVDGVEVLEVRLANDSGATASIITWGAVLRDLIVPAAGGPQRVVLGLETLDHYRAYSPHFGATAGRFANRIAGGRFELDGRTYELPLNDKGRNCLHGGPHGFGKRPWTLARAERTSATLTLTSPDGDAGFPGTLHATCVYTFAEPGTLVVEMSAVTEAPTIVNLAHHSYFNLDGSPDILDHEVMIEAEFRTPTDDVLIPTGAIEPVAGTPYDFRSFRTVRNPAGVTYDGNWVLTGAVDPASGLTHAATVRSRRNGLTLTCMTDQPGVQFYDAAKLACPVPGLGGARYGAHAGLCLEAQRFPDAPHHRHFPSAVLRPGETYRQRTEYRFA